MNLNKKKEQKAQPDLSNLSVRRRQEAEEQMAKAKRYRLYTVIAAVAAILVAALLIWDSGVIQRSAPAYTIGEQSYSATDVDYFFYNAYNETATYASYIEGYNLDTSVSLKEQYVDEEETQTWYDYFLTSALDSLSDVSALTTAAQEEGYTISQEGQANIDSAMETLTSTAANYGLTESTYLSYFYGRYMTVSSYKSIVTKQALAMDYAQYKTESFEVSQEDLDAYYQENAATLDSFDYQAYLLTVGLTTEYDEDGNALDYDAGELAAAQETLGENAARLEDAMKAGEQDQVEQLVAELGASSLSSLSSSSLSYYPFGSWLSDESRQAGDVGLVEYTQTDSEGNEYLYGYYVVKFNGRTLDEYYGVNFYNMLVQADVISDESEEETAGTQETDSTEETGTQYDWDAALAEAEELKAQWEADGGDAGSFLAMAEEHTDGSTTSYTNVAKDAQNEEVNDWLFGSEHNPGDCEIIRDETLHGYRIVYFVGYDELYYWQTIAQSDLQEERYQDWLSSAKEGQETSSTFLKDYIYRG